MMAMNWDITAQDASQKSSLVSSRTIFVVRCGLSIIRQTSPSDAHKSAELNKVYHIMLIPFALTLYLWLFILLFVSQIFYSQKIYSKYTLLEQLLALWHRAVDWWFVCSLPDLIYPTQRRVCRFLPGNAVGAVGGLTHVYLRFPWNSR